MPESMSFRLLFEEIFSAYFFILCLNFSCLSFPTRHIPATNMTSAVDGDEDVANERRRVLRGRGKRDLLRLQNLTKVKKHDRENVQDINQI